MLGGRHGDTSAKGFSCAVRRAELRRPTTRICGSYGRVDAVKMTAYMIQSAAYDKSDW